ncbi:MAG TPA: ABC transporter permease [Vicinamibacterales bacterium]|nr:ABC transporter permease [Vicinamibacterales bacterium]
MKPPTLSRLLLGWLAPRNLRETLLDDLDEMFAAKVEQEGPRAARAWYRRQARSGLASLVTMRARTAGSTGSAPAVSAPASGFGFDSLIRDTRYALRMLRRAPAFTAAAVLTVALGVGATTTVFSVVYGLLVKPLPYPAADRLVMVWQDMRARGGPATEWATPGNFVDWQADTSLFSSMASIRGWRPTLTGMGDPESFTGELVTQRYFEVLGIRPAIGRTFTANEMLPTGPRVVILSDAIWRRRFGGDPGVLGRRVVLGSEPHEIVGVMPAGFRPVIINDADLWRPDRLNLANPSRGAVVLRVIARLPSGLAMEQAAVAARTLGQKLETQYPQTNTSVAINVVSLQEQTVGEARPGLLVLLGAVVVVLLIGCVNIANLLLARASSRSREIAVRTALGAARGRVMRQLLTESLVLAGIGGVLGVVLSYWGVKGLVRIAPAGAPRLAEVGIDPAVIMFAAAVTGLAGVLFGLAPALHMAREHLALALKASGRGTAGVVGRQTRRVLIVAEVAVALVLLVGGGLLLRTFVQLQRVDLGFDPSNVLVGAVLPPPAKYRTPEDRTVFYDQVLERAAALPGVKTAAIASVIPLAGGGDSDMSFTIEGAPPPRSPEESSATWYRLVSASYLETFGVPLRRGRNFAAREAEPVVLINETMARRHFAGKDAVGGRMRFSDDGPWFRIVGIAGDVKGQGARAELRGQTYIPYWQLPEPGVAIALKTHGDPEVLSAPLRHAVREIDPDMPVSNVATMSSLVADSIEEPRFLALLVGIFAALALLLAAIGIYGVLSYAVSQRTAEIGVRLALGAGGRDVFSLIVTDGLKLTLIGVAIGVVTSILVAPALSTLLFEVQPIDPVTFVAVVGMILAVAICAAVIPARRGMRVDPLTALRTE